MEHLRSSKFYSNICPEICFLPMRKKMATVSAHRELTVVTIMVMASESRREVAGESRREVGENPIP